MEALGIVLVVALAAAAVHFGRRLAQPPAAAPAAEESPPVPVDDGEHAADSEHAPFAAIRRSDPAFDLGVFRRRVGEMFLAYHAAFAKRDLRPARRFIDDRYYPVLADRVTSAGPAVGHPQMRVERVQVTSVTAEHGMDRVRVLVSAVYPGRSAESRHVKEHWTLARRSGARTRAGVSVRTCPNCGATTGGADPTRCAYCGARLADPCLDWIVSSIDRE